ncbi:MAG: electron transfer flavoprotein subunit alpha/FixB family protein [Chloroflexota bacterium]|nr:electron transfer flavoprotein subunit alpha/FixB family protein [Chloroflexota bacterium]
MADNKGVLICGELIDGKPAPSTLELLGGGRALADKLGEPLMLALLGSGLGDAAKEGIAYGADKVFTVDDALLKDYATDAYISVMQKIVQQVAPNILLMGTTPMGRDLAPRLAFKLETAVSMDCLELAIDDASKLMLATRAVFGGNARGVFLCEGTKPQMATVRSKAMDPREADASRTGEIAAIDAGLDASAVRTKVTNTVKEEVAGIKLEDAEVIIAGGRGIASAEGFKMLDPLAATLKAATGASRPPCDNGWVSPSIQIGLTGKIVGPALYIAVAVSGSSQHMAGCSGAKNIVAINKDPEANIFKEARFGVVGDFNKIIPAFTDKVKELVG